MTELAQVKAALLVCYQHFRVSYEQNFVEEKHKRDSNGKFTSSNAASGDKEKSKKPNESEPGLAVNKPVGQKEQRHAERNQDKLAATLKGAQSIPGNAPSDVEQVKCKPPPCNRRQLELKTLLTSHRGKVKMTAAAQARKLLRMHEGDMPARQFTVVIDHRRRYAGGRLAGASVFPLYIREGTGSFKLSSMHRVNTAAELEELLSTPTEELPEKAKPPTTGFYAAWVSAGVKKRQAGTAGRQLSKGQRRLAKQALAKEKERTARRRKMKNELLR